MTLSTKDARAGLDATSFLLGGANAVVALVEWVTRIEAIHLGMIEVAVCLTCDTELRWVANAHQLSTLAFATDGKQTLGWSGQGELERWDG
jgi:hypothetical protein